VRNSYERRGSIGDRQVPTLWKNYYFRNWALGGLTDRLADALLRKSDPTIGSVNGECGQGDARVARQTAWLAGRRLVPPRRVFLIFFGAKKKGQNSGVSGGGGCKCWCLEVRQNW